MKRPGLPLRVPLKAAVLLLALVFPAAPAREAGAAPTILGPSKCDSCHDHEKQKKWEDKDTHTKALEQLDDADLKNGAKVKKYLAALGLSDPYKLNGLCVGCHATIFNGDANAGVSCETCHGPGSAYLEPHQKKGSHAESVRLGLIDTRDSYTVWANLCVNCHVVTDKKLTDAGHSSGADFELAEKTRKIRESAPGVKHWEPTYDDAKLREAGRIAMRARGGAVSVPKTEVKPAAPPATATKAAPKASPTVTAAPAPTRAPVEEKATARPAPTLTPTRPAPKTVPPSEPSVTQTVAPARPPERPPTASPSPAPPPSPAAASGIQIVIEASPIPTAAPRVREAPTSPPPAVEAAPEPTSRPSPRPTKRPTPRKPRPNPRPTVSPAADQTPPPATAPAPAITPVPPTPTRIKAPTTMIPPH